MEGLDLLISKTATLVPEDLDADIGEAHIFRPLRFQTQRYDAWLGWDGAKGSIPGGRGLTRGETSPEKVRLYLRVCKQKGKWSWVGAVSAAWCSTWRRVFLLGSLGRSVQIVEQLWRNQVLDEWRGIHSLHADSA